MIRYGRGERGTQGEKCEKCGFPFLHNLLSSVFLHKSNHPPDESIPNYLYLCSSLGLIYGRREGRIEKGEKRRGEMWVECENLCYSFLCNLLSSVFLHGSNHPPGESPLLFYIFALFLVRIRNEGG